MAQGLVMFDPQKRLILCNSRYLEIYGLSPDVVKPGCTKEELLRHQKNAGNLSDDVHQYCAALYAAIADGRILKHDREYGQRTHRPRGVQADAQRGLGDHA
jgi:PAS domain-containing protein